MSYTNTGFKRATTLTIQVLENGVFQSANVLPLMSAFTQGGVAYPAVVADDIAKLSNADYTARVTAYAAYVQANYQSQYPGLAVTTDGSRVYDITSCPLT